MMISRSQLINVVLFSIATFCLSLPIANNLQAQITSAMSYNIKYDNPSDSLNNWDKRKAELVESIQYYGPDVLGIQEGLLHQLQYFDNQLSNYARIGVGRDDGKEKGEFSPIYYNHDKLTMIYESTFWLSEMDSQVSVGWDASMERICTYGLFQNKETAERILIFNTHFDHIGQLAREKSAELIIHKIEEINTGKYPVILMGDFNAEPLSQAISTITTYIEDVAKITPLPIYGPLGTFTGFQENIIPTRRIDYIFTLGLRPKSVRHIDDRMRNGNYLSDHLPVMVTF